MPATGALFKDVGSIAARSARIRRSPRTSFRSLVNWLARRGKASRRIGVRDQAGYTTNGIRPNRVKSLKNRLTGTANRIAHKLGLDCLTTRIVQPWLYVIRRVKRTLGIQENEPVKTDCASLPQCESEELEERVIDRELPKPGCPNGGCPDLDELMEGEINMASKCIRGMKEPSFGVRVRVMLIDDASCDDPQYAPICEEEMAKSRVVNCPEPR